jgi:hypothetical protein
VVHPTPFALKGFFHGKYFVILTSDNVWKVLPVQQLERRLRLHFGTHRTSDRDGPNGSALTIVGRKGSE